MKRTAPLVAISVLVYVSCISQKGDRLYSKLKGNEVTILPYGIRFHVPDHWLEWKRHYGNGNNLHMTRRELSKVKNGAGQWDSEYAAVVNAVLAFERCGFHGGEEGWGHDGFGFSDLQMRVYVVQERAEALEGTIEMKARASILSLMYLHNREEIVFERGQLNSWSLNAYAFPLYFGDYGGTANVDFWARRFEKATVVVVFMYAGTHHEATIRSIVDSLSWPASD